MRICLVIAIVMCMATTLFASDSFQVKGRIAADIELRDWATHCQAPDPLWYAINASSAFDAEMADDVPDAYENWWINEMEFWVIQWGGGWINPLGVMISVYDGECPPAMNPVDQTYFTWNGPDMMTQFEYEDPGWMVVYHVRLWMPNPIQVASDMSLGIAVDTDWGTNPPYAGLAMTIGGDIYGDCEAYGDWNYWGYPRWTSTTYAVGTPYDIGMCLIMAEEPVDSEVATWGAIKELYK